MNVIQLLGLAVANVVVNLMVLWLLRCWRYKRRLTVCQAVCRQAKELCQAVIAAERKYEGVRAPY